MCEEENNGTNNDSSDPNIEDVFNDVPEPEWDEAIIGSRRNNIDNPTESKTDNEN